MRNIIGFIFLGLATHLLDKDLINSLNIGVPFCSHCYGDGESHDRVWLTGQEEEGCRLGAGINLVLLPFQRHQLELRENKSCEQRRPKEREIIAVKCHYRPRIRRLQGIDPRRSGSASNAQSHYRPRHFNDVRNQVTKRKKQCATVETLHLSKVAPNARIDSIAVTHMERRVQ